jgi:hypothetical protein
MNLGIQNPALYLLTLPAIRDRCSKVHDLAKQDKLQYFSYHPENEDKAVNTCIKIIKVMHPNLIEVDL